MSITIEEHCDVCGKVLEGGDEIIQLQNGVARGRGVLRDLFSSIFVKRYGIGWVHVDCLDGVDSYDGLKEKHKVLTDLVDEVNEL